MTPIAWCIFVGRHTCVPGRIFPGIMHQASALKFRVCSFVPTVYILVHDCRTVQVYGSSFLAVYRQYIERNNSTKYTILRRPSEI